MSVEIEEIGADRLSKYAAIPIAFKVESIFHVDLVGRGLGGIQLHEQMVAKPYTKDYDAYDDAERPKQWPHRFDISNWGIFLASEDSQPVGGATVAYNTAGVHMLAGRKDLAVLWDIRVRPDSRRKGIGTALFRYACQWTKQRGCKQLKIETQNINVPACRFYAKHGCLLGEINKYAYAQISMRMLITQPWRMKLCSSGTLIYK
jgi:GNAT superfamily N-acetyltransferase